MTAIPKPKRGRPPKLGDKKGISLDIPAELLTRIDKAAKAAGKPRSEWLRDVAAKHLDTVPGA